jgi:hypothetical protein
MNKNMVADLTKQCAEKQGERLGRNAASWYEADDWSAVLKGVEDGDPAIYDTFPNPDLSGQWADEVNGTALVADCFPGDPDRHCRLWAWIEDNCFTEACDAFEDAFRVACEDEIVRRARFQVAE